MLALRCIYGKWINTDPQYHDHWGVGREASIAIVSCQISHAYSQERLVARPSEQLDITLWAAYRAVDEQATVLRMAAEAGRQSDTRAFQRFIRFARVLKSRKSSFGTLS